MRVGLSQRKNGLLSALALSRNFSASSRISSSTVSMRFGHSSPASSIFCLPTLPQRGSTVASSTWWSPPSGPCCADRPAPAGPADSSDGRGLPSHRGDRDSRRTGRSHAPSAGTRSCRQDGSCRTGRWRSPCALSAVAMVGAAAGKPDRRAGLADRGHAGADRQLAGDEVGAARRAARLGVVVGEQHALGGDLVEVRRAARHHAAVVGADVPDADVVAHDDDDVGPLLRRRLRLRCWLRRPATATSARPRRSARRRIARCKPRSVLRRAVSNVRRSVDKNAVRHGVILLIVMHQRLLA